MGAKHPKHKGEVCYGENLSSLDYKSLVNFQFDLSYLIKAYQSYSDKTNFFNPFFTKLAGTKKLQKAIEEGQTIEEIKASWQGDLQRFKAMRKSYLLYDDFE